MNTKTIRFAEGDHVIWLTATHTSDDVHMVLNAGIRSVSEKPYASILVEADEIPHLINNNRGRCGHLLVCATGFKNQFLVCNSADDSVSDKPMIWFNERLYDKVRSSAFRLLLEFQRDYQIQQFCNKHIEK